MIDLAGVWSLVDESGTYSTPMTLPGDGIDALFKAGAIPDPYFGRNEYGLRWICQRDWVASRSFTVASVDQVLVVSMLDTVAEVRINGVLVLASRQHVPQLARRCVGALRVGDERGDDHLPLARGRGGKAAGGAALFRAVQRQSTPPSPTATCCASRSAISAGTGTSRWRRSGFTAISIWNPRRRRGSRRCLVTQAHTAGPGRGDGRGDGRGRGSGGLCPVRRYGACRCLGRQGGGGA